MSGPSLRATQDPWDEHGHAARPLQCGRRNLWAVVLPVIAFVAVVAVWAGTRSPGRPGGDPGGRILDALQRVRTVVPVDATGVSTTAHDSTHSARCPDNPGGRSGWSAVTVYSTFRSPQTGPQVVSAIGAGLAHLGWRPAQPVWERNFEQYPPQAAWQKTLFPGQTATATVYQLPAGNGPYSGSWHFGAVARPPGFALPGC